jgi:molybdenum cofactor cytidylyltransferase
LASDNIAGLILSAGLSGRMKRFKPLLDYKGKTFIENIITSLDVICKQIIVITGHNSDHLQKETIKRFNGKEILNKVNFIYNESYFDEMFTSLQKGISSIRDKDWVLYHFVDQPGLPPDFYSDFINQTDNNSNWIQPVYKNCKGHPILLHKDLFPLIMNQSPGSTLRSVSQNQIVKKKYWECNYPEIFQDIDTEEDLTAINN